MINRVRRLDRSKDDMTTKKRIGMMQACRALHLCTHLREAVFLHYTQGRSLEQQMFRIK